ncbi:MAG: hypothetical protein HQL48_06845 [Gammaproteobacteria bacterium]|nr:hypothetical protein [Gammaproteobacteria bacterium]
MKEDVDASDIHAELVRQSELMNKLIQAVGGEGDKSITSQAVMVPLSWNWSWRGRNSGAVLRLRADNSLLADGDFNPLRKRSFNRHFVFNQAYE